MEPTQPARQQIAADDGTVLSGSFVEATMADESSPGRARIRGAFLTGIAVIVPSVITLAVLAVVFNAIYDYLNVFSSAIGPLFPHIAVPVFGAVGTELIIELATPIVFIVSIILLGVVVESTRYGERAVDYTDYTIEQIPGVGSVYQGFRQMSDAMLESDGGNFREVVLVEFPTEDVYTLAFVTSETPETIADPTESGEMRTLFMPMAPNPVMGGHVVFVPERRIVEIDLSVDEGIRALVTSGVALERVAAETDGVSPDQIRAGSPDGHVGSYHSSMSEAAKRSDEPSSEPGSKTSGNARTDTRNERDDKQ